MGKYLREKLKRFSFLSCWLLHYISLSTVSWHFLIWTSRGIGFSSNKGEEMRKQQLINFVSRLLGSRRWMESFWRTYMFAVFLDHGTKWRLTTFMTAALWIFRRTFESNGRTLLDFNGACKDLASVEIWQKMEYYFDGTKTLDLSGFKRNFDFLKKFFIDLSDNAAAILKSMQNSNYCYDCSQWEKSKSFPIGDFPSNGCYFAYFSIWPQHYRKGLLWQSVTGFWWDMQKFS